MPIRNYKPTTPASRDMSSEDSSEITRTRPKKSLTHTYKDRAGRSNSGTITVRHRGGSAKRRYRTVDFGLAPGTHATVEAIEYDPNRSSHVALIRDASGRYSYVLAGNRMRVGDEIQAGESAAVKPGNRLPLSEIPLGSSIYNIEASQGKGGQLARSAGAKAQIMSSEGEYVYIRLPSTEVRLIHRNCYATLGNVGNEQHQNVKIGSAGRNRRKGKRPSVRGKAMNPADHPLGGGEGLSGPGRLPRTPWGKLAVGKKTRHRKQGSYAIIRTRSRKRKK